MEINAEEKERINRMLAEWMGVWREDFRPYGDATTPGFFKGEKP